jgi:hypothetical protein
MNRLIKKYRIYLFLVLAMFTVVACKTDEFKFGDISIKEDWDIDVISPLFTGNGMEFNDFVFDWKKNVPSTPAPFTVLEYAGKNFKTIPADLIFAHSAIIDSFPFYIQGAYSLSEVELIFTVKNGSPFALNLQLQFFDKRKPGIMGPIVLPPPFAAANFAVSPVIPIPTVHSLKLDPLQLASFINSDRVRFTSWYDRNDFINQNDTISAHYPVDVSIVLKGAVKGKNED